MPEAAAGGARSWRIGRSTRWRRRRHRARGSCADPPALIPGGQVQIADAGPASGTYDVTEVEHIYTAPRLRDPFHRRRSPARAAWSTRCPDPGASSASAETGLVIGVVTNNGGSRLRRPGQGQVTSLGDHVESNWARVVTVGGGSQRGMTFLPEVNDEVIVGFEGGDAAPAGGARRPVQRPGRAAGLRRRRTSQVQKRQITSRLGPCRRIGRRRQRLPTSTSALTLAGGAASDLCSARTSCWPRCRRASRRPIRAGDVEDRDRRRRVDHAIAGAEDHPQGRRPTSRSPGMNITAKANAKVEPICRGPWSRCQGQRSGRGVRRRPDRRQGRDGDGQLMDEVVLPNRGSTEPAQYDATFIGRGFYWPMQVDHTGSIRLTDGAADLDRSMAVVLATAPGERVMRPQFGCRIWDLLFEPVTREPARPDGAGGPGRAGPMGAPGGGRSGRPRCRTRTTARWS